MDAKKLRDMAAELNRLADGCEVKEKIPACPRPSQEWLDNRELDLTGEFRAPKFGELFKEIGSNDCAECALSDWSHNEPRWILRKRAAAVPPAGLLKGDWEHTGELREPKMVSATSWEPWMATSGDVIENCAPHQRGWPLIAGNLAGYTDLRRWIVRPKAKPAPKVTPWELSPVHAGKVVDRNDGTGWGTINGVRDFQFIITGWGKVSPDELLRDWTHDDKPCGEVAK